ncbi:BZ3501_MvSof-1269-A2-R1_Chr1-2g01043 [Microbotryum saponariae]|nr:BZ3501_MvSof-1269-A2-R1_Chr1-2g01043 [Microbotryum saponariae]
MSSSSRWGRCLIHPHYHPQSHQVSSSALGRGRRESGQSASASTTPFVRAIHTSSTSAAVEGVLPKRNGERNGPPPIAPLPTPPPRTSSFSKLKARTIPTRSQSHVKDVSRITGAHADNPVGEMYYEMDISDGVHEIPYDDLVSALYATRETPLVDEQDLSEEGVPGIEGLFEDGEGNLRGGAEESLDWQVLLDELVTRDHREGSKVETTKAKAREIEKPEIVPAPKPTTTTTTTSSSMEIKPSKSSTCQTPEPVSTPIPASTRAPIVKAIPAIITPTKRLAPLGKARDLNPSPRPIGILPYTPPSNVSPTDPSSRPLLSRYDWRANKLVGVGHAPYFSGRRIKDVEGWGWKGRVPQGEKGTWRAADRHRIKIDRLLDLNEEAEEKSYLETLARSGTPEQRETLGRTVCRAQGMWLTKSKRTDEILKMTREEKDELRRKSAGGGGVISTWRNCEGGDLDEANGYKFVPGTILRFIPLKSENVGSGPAPPPSHAPKHPQGSVLEVQNGRLIVIFEEADMWVLGQEEYRIDIGVDDASYHLQRAAIDSLYFDSARQRLRNERTWQAAHMAFARTKICSTVREWTLQGTDVRELIVPTEATPAVEVAQNPAEFSFDDLIDGRDESAIVPASMTQVEETTPRPASNPSPLLCDNQLINSWVKRHQRSPPLAMEGDPILRLNDSQTRAVAMAMSESLSLIQGPPGTGKSATLVTLIHLLKTHFRIPQPILLCAPTHVSIDHLLSLLIDAGLNPLRMGKAYKVREELREWTVERRREGHPLWDLCEGARVECERIREELDGLRETVGVDKKGLERISELGLGSEMGRRALMLCVVLRSYIAVEMEEILKNEWRRFVTLEQRLYSSLLATADVFCSTTIGAGATKIMSMIDFPIVFLDEAAMCTEPVSLIPLMKGAQHVCFIGDQKQLPAVVKSREAVQNRLHVSLFERLMAEKAVQTTLLDTQYRMRPQISAFPNQAFYNSALKDAPNVSKRSSPPKSTYLQMNAETGKPDPCVFISHEGAETFFRQSTLNETEVDLIVSIVGDLLTRNPELDASTIGIISPYASQTRLLSDTFSIGDRRGFSSRVIDRWGFDIALRASQVEVNTVDGYQGREKSIIILSTVRSNPANFIGFLSDRRRLNVALTRAKDLLFVVGNERTLGFARSGWGGRGRMKGTGGRAFGRVFWRGIEREGG